MTCPAAPAPTPPRWPTAQPTSLTASSARTSAGRMPVGPRRSWRSTSPRPGTASAPCCPWRALPWLPSTVAMATTCSSSPGAKGQGRLTSSALSSPRSSTTKWTSCPGLSARATGAGITRPGLPTTDRNARRAPRMKITSSSSRRPGSIKETPLWCLWHKCTALICCLEQSPSYLHTCIFVYITWVFFINYTRGVRQARRTAIWSHLCHLQCPQTSLEPLLGVMSAGGWGQRSQKKNLEVVAVGFSSHPRSNVSERKQGKETEVVNVISSFYI